MNNPTFTKQQIAFVADKILAAAFDRIESCLPDTVPLKEYEKLKKEIDHSINYARDTAAMALAILFAQTTGEGMGAYDWAGSNEFCAAVAQFVRERTDPNWQGLKEGEPCYPDTQPLADMFAEEWAKARKEKPPIKEGDMVKWVAPPAKVGPHHRIAVDTGEIREVVSILDQADGEQLLTLAGRDNVGIFGWTNASNVEKVET